MRILQETSASDKAAALSGIAGTAALLAYFAAPAFSGWPYAGARTATLVAYAEQHQSLFYAGAWLQGTGTVLCILCFIGILRAAGSLTTPAGVAALIGASTLLAVVLVEGALLVAVPVAAAAGDSATTATTFALSNGAFLRVFPLAPASLTYVALGAAMLSSPRFDRRLGQVAIAVGLAFEAAGLVAVFSTWALAVIAALSAAQALWIVAAAVALWRTRA
jgi:hypothetical protein